MMDKTKVINSVMEDLWPVGTYPGTGEAELTGVGVPVGVGKNEA